MKLVGEKTFKKFLIFIIVFFVLFPVFSLANPLFCSDYKDQNSCENHAEKIKCSWDSSISQCCPATQISWPTSPTGIKLTGCSDLGQMVKYFYEWGITLGALLAFLVLIVGGLQFLTSVGEPAKVKEAKDRIISALAGLALLLCSYLILNILNPSLTTLEKPSTKIENLISRKIEEIERPEPCQWVVLYRNRGYQEPYVIFFGEKVGDEDKVLQDLNLDPQKFRSEKRIEEINDCKKVGDKGWWITGLGKWQDQILSVKMKGACQVNFYESENCSGGFTAIGRSTFDLSTVVPLGRIFSIKPIDVSPPYPPTVENLESRTSGSSVTLKGKVTDLGNSDVVECFFEYGPQIEEGQEIYDLRKTIKADPEEIYQTETEFQATISNLEKGKYGWRAVCVNEAGAGFPKNEDPKEGVTEDIKSFQIQ